MPERPSHEVTQLLNMAQGGDSRAAEELLPLVYDELRRLARARMNHEAAGQTIQATALVHEAYLRLLGPGGEQLAWDGRGHFFGAAARAMRRILVERARARRRIKRGGGAAKVALDDNAVAAAGPEGPAAADDHALELEQALTELEALDRRKSEVVMLRYFAGLTVEEAALALNVSPATVKNDWAFARAWLNNRITQLAAADPAQAAGGEA